MRRRILSLLLCLAMLATMVPLGALATTVDESQAPTVAGETVPSTTEETTTETTGEAVTPTTEEADVPETSEEPIPEATKESIPAPTEESVPETTEETVPETTGETVPETTEETQPEEGFPGMPQGFTLSASQKEDKENLAKNDVVKNLEKRKEGTDYVAGQILFQAATKEEAQTIAGAYGASLVSYSAKIAVAKLTDATVAEAVAVAADVTNNMPAVDPVYIHKLQPQPELPFQAPHGAMPFAMQAPEIQVWENFKDGDPCLEDPNSADYQWFHDMVNTYEAWGVTQGAGVTVAVLDGGVDENHEDLQGRVTVLNEYEGISFSTDSTGHGTHVAGLIAATQGNHLGGAGVAPQANILSINILADEIVYDSMIMIGIRAAVAKGADIINLSLGNFASDSYSATMQRVVTDAYNAGVTIFAAMGNSYSNTRYYPACLEHVIAVAAVNRAGERAEFSTYGDWADLAAPGQWVLSTIPGDEYLAADGSSLATPIAAGVAALYISALGENPGPEQVEAALKAAATKAGSGMGSGIVDAAKLFSSDTTKPKLGVFDVDWDKGSEEEAAADPLSAPTGVTREQMNTMFRSAVISDSRQSSGAKIYGDYALAILPGNDSTNNKMLIYTIDGTNPAVKNGVVTNGTALYLNQKSTDEDSGEATAPNVGYAFNLKFFPVNQKITVKAAFVSGMGVMSKISTLSFKITPGAQDVTEVRVLGDVQLQAGKSATYTAVVEPAQFVDQAVTWAIADQVDAPGAKLSTKGLLTTKATDTGTITIQATSVADKTVVGTLEVELLEPKVIVPIKSLAINASKLTLGTTQSQCGYAELALTKLINANNEDVLDDEDYNTKIRWTSSNPKVASVNEHGEVEAWALGKATITCTTTDGSRKSAKCVVTVVTPPEELTITGQSNIARGKSASYKATIYPTAANKNVTWTLQQLDGENLVAPEDVTVSTTGVVKVAKNAPEQILVLTATSVTGWADASMIIRVSSPTTYVKLYAFDDAHGVTWAEKTDGSVSVVNLYSCDIPETAADDHTFPLEPGTSNPVGVLWSSSKPSVATVDADGVITAKAAGKTVITCKANDGSGKKATLVVNVTVPASYLTVQSGLNTMAGEFVGDLFPESDDVGFEDIYTLAWGRSTTNKAVLGDTYGKASSAKVTWSYELVRRGYRYDPETGDYEPGCLTEKDDTTLRQIRKNKLVTLSSSGKLSFAKKLGNYDLSSEPVYVIVYATIDYGSHTVEGRRIYRVVDPTTKLRFEPNKTITLSAEQWMEQERFFAFTSDAALPYNVTVTSSNPKVLNVVSPVDYDDLGRMGVTCMIAREGTAKLTIKANDGTGKTATITVRIK